MRLLFLSLFVCLILVPAPALAAEQQSWTGNSELDAAFVHNNTGQYAEALVLFSKLYKQGVPMAGTMLGRYYEDGRACTQDREKALSLYAEAESKNEAFGIFHHARATSDNLELLTAKELERIVAVLTPEAEKGNVPVQTALGATYLFLSGAGPERSRWTPPEAWELAERWMRKAAEAGYAPAQNNMPIFDSETVQEWREKAAASGYPPALKALGR